MRLIPLVATLAGLAGAAMGADTVAGIQVEGARRVSSDRVLMVMSSRIGQPLDPQALKDDRDAIARIGPFGDVRIDEVRSATELSKVTLVVHVTELPLVGSLEYSGLSYFQKSGLDKVIQTTVGGYLDPIRLESDRRALIRHLETKGYSGVRVDVAAPVELGVANVTFTVDLGHEIQVGTTIYRGLPPRVYPVRIDQVLINQPGRPYVPEMVELDQKAVCTYLQDLGYLDAVVGRTEVDWFDFVRPGEDRRRHGPLLVPDHRVDDRVSLTFPVTPGTLWTLGSVAFVGNTVATEAELRTAFGLRDGAVFKREDIEKAVERARRLISNQGYARARFDLDRRPDLENHRMHLTVHVFEGDLYTVDRVDIKGNYRTKDAVVRRALAIRPGDLYNDDALDESRRQLNRIGLFSREAPLRISPRFDEDNPGHVDMVVDLQEGDTAAIRLQAGYSSATGPFGEIVYTERNFDLLGALSLQNWRGAGQVLDTSLFVGKERNSFGASWTNPHLYDGPYSFSLGANRSDSTLREWDEVRITGTSSVGRNFINNDLKVALSYSYTDLRIRKVESDASNEALLTGAGGYFLQSEGLTETYDRLDHPTLPTSGFRLSAYQEATGAVLPSSAQNLEYRFKGDGFIPLTTADLGGATFLHLGWLWRQKVPIAGDDTVPFYDRIYGGGPAPAHRGFGRGDLGPREININGREARVGGTTEELATAELSIPLQGTNEGIRLVLFTDYGDVWGSEERIQPFDLRTAVGFGIRFPVSLPVSLDFAWLLDARKGESQSQIHFSMAFYTF